MKQFNIELVRRDKVKVELDPEFLTKNGFAEFRQFFYDYETLEEIAQYITFNVVHNNETLSMELEYL